MIVRGLTEVAAVLGPGLDPLVPVWGGKQNLVRLVFPCLSISSNLYYVLTVEMQPFQYFSVVGCTVDRNL
jgi:hypothetical protein